MTAASLCSVYIEAAAVLLDFEALTEVEADASISGTSLEEANFTFKSTGQDIPLFAESCHPDPLDVWCNTTIALSMKATIWITRHERVTTH